MALKKIAIISPASPTLTYDKDMVKATLNELGYTPVYGKNAFKSSRFMAGSDTARVADLMAAFTDDTIEAILCMRGGYGSARLLDKIEYKTIAKHPKPLFGLSDITALQLALWHKCQLVSFSGVQAGFLEKPIDDVLKETFRAALNHEYFTFENLTPLTKGVAHGRLIGGTLSLIVSLMGTPYMPDLTGAILVIEEVGEQPYRIDRMLGQLALAGVFDKVAGIVLGSFHNCLSKDIADGTVEEVLLDRFGKLNKPVVLNFPYGHGPDKSVFPIGGKATLDATKGILQIDEY